MWVCFVRNYWCRIALTHLDLHICIRELDHHCPRKWIVLCLKPGRDLKPRNCNRNKHCIRENAFQSVLCIFYNGQRDETHCHVMPCIKSHTSPVSAVFVSLRSILMVELIGLDRLTNAFGLVTMCQGLSAFIGAPIAGKLLYYRPMWLFTPHVLKW